MILFLIYINDIDVSVTCNVLKFADDTKIYRIVNSQEDIESLRNNLKNLVKWSVDCRCYLTLTNVRLYTLDIATVMLTTICVAMD